MPLPNPPQPITQLLAVWTTDVVRKRIVGALVSMGIRADLWPTGGVASSVITDVATIIASASQAAVDAISAGWLPTAVAGWLDWLAVFFYGVSRNPATFANGALLLTNTGGGIFPPAGGQYQPGEVIAQNPTTKETYVNTVPFSLAAGPGTTATPNFQCVDAGTVGNSAAGQISALVTSMIGVTVTNPVALLGTDAESDDDLRQKCFNSLGARSVRGPRTAYAYAIQTATNPVTGSLVNINRYTLSSSSHTGQIAIVVASPSGVPDPNDVVGVSNNIEAVARPECVQVGVTAATAIVISGSLTVYLPPQPGVTADQVAAGVAASLAAFFATYPIGGRTADNFTGVHATGIDAAAAAGWPGIFAVDGSEDVPMTASQVAVSTIAAVNITVSFQAQ